MTLRKFWAQDRVLDWTMDKSFTMDGPSIWLQRLLDGLLERKRVMSVTRLALEMLKRTEPTGVGVRF